MPTAYAIPGRSTWTAHTKTLRSHESPRRRRSATGSEVVAHTLCHPSNLLLFRHTPSVCSSAHCYHRSMCFSCCCVSLPRNSLDHATNQYRLSREGTETLHLL